MRTAKDLSSLGMYGDTPELSLLADAIRTTTSCKGLGVIKLFFMLNSTEHKMYPAHKF